MTTLRADDARAALARGRTLDFCDAADLLGRVPAGDACPLGLPLRADEAAGGLNGRVFDAAGAAVLFVCVPAAAPALAAEARRRARWVAAALNAHFALADALRAVLLAHDAAPRAAGVSVPVALAKARRALELAEGGAP